MVAGSLSVGGSEKALEEDGISGWKVDSGNGCTVVLVH